MQKKNDWFFQCLEELRLPGNSWHQVSNLITERLADRIKLEGLTHDQLTRVSKFVGADFMKKYQLNENLDSSDGTVSQAKLSSDEEVQRLLKDLTLKAAKDAECALPVDSSSEQCFIDLVNHIKQMYLSKQEDTNNYMSAGYSDLYSVAEESQVEALGLTIVEILQRDTGKLDKIISSLKGRLMPKCLRNYLYRLFLLKRKKNPGLHSDNNNEESISSDTTLNQQMIREKFAAGVKSGLMQLKMRNPTETPIGHLIRSTVVETFDTNTGIVLLSKNASMQQEMCRVLNIFYTKTRIFEYVNVLWLLPLQISLSKNSFAKENDIELAMWLDLFITEMIPSWDVVNKVVLSTWIEAVKFSENVPFKDLNLKTCLSSLGITFDQDEVKMLLQRNDPFVYSRQSSSGRLQSPSSYVTHPVILIRQWLLHLFVGCTTLKNTLFMWDQLFLHNWSKKCLKRACLTFILCIAEQVAICKNQSELFEVFQIGLNGVELKYVMKAWKQINELAPL